MKKKNKLDEMQEKKLLEIEHNGYWLAFWGLLIAMVVQLVLYGTEDCGKVAGEWIVFMCLAIYVTISCMKNGIWDRHLSPTPAVNLTVSLVSGGVTGIVFFLISYRNYHSFIGSIMTGIFTMIQIFVLCFGGLTIASALHRKKTEQLENEEEEPEEDGK